MVMSLTTDRPRSPLYRRHSRTSIASWNPAAARIRPDDEAAGWLAPETIVPQAVLAEKRFARMETAQTPATPAPARMLMSLGAVAATAAILLTLLT